METKAQQIETSSNEKALKAGVLYLIAELITRGISFLMTPVFARLLPEAVFANAKIFDSWMYLIAPVLSLSLYQSLPRARFDYGKNYKGYLSSILTLTIAVSLVALVIGAIFSGVVEQIFGFSRMLMFVMLLYSLGYNGMQSVQLYERQMMNYKKNILLTILAVVPSVILSVTAVVLVSGKVTDEQMLNVRILSFSIPVIVIGMAVMGMSMAQGREFVDKEKWKYGVRFSVPMMITTLAAQVFFQSATIVVQKIVSLEAAAVVTIAMTVGYIMDILVHAIDNAWRPWLYDKIFQKDVQSVRRFWMLILMAVTLMIWCLTMVSPELVLILGGAKYMDAVPLVCPILCSSLANFLLITYTAIEQYYKKTRISGVASVVSAVVNVALNIIFVKLFGYQMVAYTTMASYFIACLIHYLMIRGFETDDLLCTGKSMAVILGAFALCLVSTLSFGLSLLWRVGMILAVVMIIGFAARKQIIGMLKAFKPAK